MSGRGSDRLIHMEDRCPDLAHFVYMDNLDGITIGDESRACHRVSVMPDEWHQLFEGDNLLLHAADIDLDHSLLLFHARAPILDVGPPPRRCWKVFCFGRVNNEVMVGCHFVSPLHLAFCL